MRAAIFRVHTARRTFAAAKADSSAEKSKTVEENVKAPTPKPTDTANSTATKVEKEIKSVQANDYQNKK